MDDIQLRIGQLAALVGVTTKTIRHYHKIGLLPPPERSPNNYRQYNFADLYRLKLVLRLKSVGFSLGDIRSILQADDPDHALQQRLRDLELGLAGQIRHLQGRRRRVQALLDEGATLRDVDLPDARSSLTYQLLADVLQEYVANSSADVKALDQALLSRLDMFNWGEEYRLYWLELAHSLADNVGALHAVGEQIVAAGRLESGDPQLEEMADQAASQLGAIRHSLAEPEMERPLQELFRQVVVHAIQETFTPAQEHLVGLIRKRLYG